MVYDLVPLARLLANPKEYDGKPVQIAGFLALSFENAGLYMHREDAAHGVPLTGVWLKLDSKEYDEYESYKDRYVVVTGVFDASESGHMGLFGGGLKEVGRISALP
jgi:hypothetical protein